MAKKKQEQRTPTFWERLDLKGRIYGLDRFPEPIQLNFNKQASFPTIPGVIVTLILLLLVLTYGIQKFNKLIYRQQPTITVETAQNFFTNKDEISLNQEGFKIAFGVMDYSKNVRLSDPDFVRFQVFLEVRKDLQVVDTIPLAYHLCT
jgi:hypothetical protein